MILESYNFKLEWVPVGELRRRYSRNGASGGSSNNEYKGATARKLGLCGCLDNFDAPGVLLEVPVELKTSIVLRTNSGDDRLAKFGHKG